MNRVVYYQNAGDVASMRQCTNRVLQIMPKLNREEAALPHYLRCLERLDSRSRLWRSVKRRVPRRVARAYHFRRCADQMRAARREGRWREFLYAASRGAMIAPSSFVGVVVHGIAVRLHDRMKPLTVSFRKRCEAAYRDGLNGLAARRGSRNGSRPRILLYTDSRGFRIRGRYAVNDPMHFYPGELVKRFNVECHICPEKHTTLVDFLHTYQSSSRDFDVVVAHVGIVDFSPRGRKSAREQLYLSKKSLYDEVFGEDAMERHLAGNLGFEYEGDQTINMFSLAMAEESLLPRLRAIPDLVWIGCSRFVAGWRGNYFRERPPNISIVEDYSRLFCETLPNCVDLSDWSDMDVKKYTCDNVHLTVLGGQVLLARLKEATEALGVPW